GGSRPLPGQEVSVKVLGALEDGGLVERDPRLIFVPGHGDVVQALELGVPTMQPGEVSFFLAAFPYAYGRPGSREPDVPPEAPLLFEVTLLEVRDGPDPQPLPPAVRLRLGSQRRERGNFHFARGDFAAALRSYRLSLRALDGPTTGNGERPDAREGPGLRGWGAEAATRPAAPPGPEEEEELREQRVKCLNNCAAAELKLGRAEEALAACEAALRISPDNTRALLRRGQVGLASPHTAPLPSARLSSYPPLLSPQLLAEQGRDAEAALILRKALELDPANKVIHTELSRLAKRQNPSSST
ncbi:FKBP8 isomerase, partial [Buphagus erythrorhynchus]|nr:FKBP8 isomerase [Buphagus erythrorhynchus]